MRCVMMVMMVMITKPAKARLDRYLLRVQVYTDARRTGERDAACGRLGSAHSRRRRRGCASIHAHPTAFVTRSLIVAMNPGELPLISPLASACLLSALRLFVDGQPGESRAAATSVGEGASFSSPEALRLDVLGASFSKLTSFLK